MLKNMRSIWFIASILLCPNVNFAYSAEVKDDRLYFWSRNLDQLDDEIELMRTSTVWIDSSVNSIKGTVETIDNLSDIVNFTDDFEKANIYVGTYRFTSKEVSFRIDAPKHREDIINRIEQIPFLMDPAGFKQNACILASLSQEGERIFQSAAILLNDNLPFDKNCLTFFLLKLHGISPQNYLYWNQYKVVAITDNDLNFSRALRKCEAHSEYNSVIRECIINWMRLEINKK